MIRRNNTSYNRNFRYNVKNEKYLAIDNIYIFRENVQPKWEDPSNAVGCEY